MLHIHTIESQPFAENSYVVWRDGHAEAFVVDPGFEPDLIVEFLEAQKLDLAAIVNTHGHVDHIAGNGEMKRRYPEAPILIGRTDAPMLTDAKLNLSGGYGFNIVSPPADRLLKDGEDIEVAGIPMNVREIPGHSPGHVVFHVAEAGWILGGDVLFAGGVGRTDFPGGSFRHLKEGIHKHLWPLPDATVVFPGHGPPTTVGEEKATNPYVGAGV